MTAPDIGALRSLRDRVAAADEPSFALDREIGLTIGGWRHGEPINGWTILIDSEGNGFSDGSGAIYDECFTESLDASLALVEANGFGWRIDQDEGCTLSDADDVFDQVKAATPPLSVCAALLLALIAQREHDGGGE